MSLPTFRFAVNSQGRDKNWDFSILSSQFQDVEGTLDDAIAHIKQGHAICAGLLEGKWRCKSNFTGSYWVLAEIDNAALQRDGEGKVVKGADGKGIKIYDPQLTLEQAIEHPFISQFCSLIYTTPSHRPDWHRFRLVFRLPEFVADIDHYEEIVRFLLEQLPHDPACKDGVRVFYGNTAAEFPLVKAQACLPPEWIEQAAGRAGQERQERAEREKLLSLKREQFQHRAQEEGWDTDRLIEQALACIPPRTPGGGNYQECITVLKALHDYYGFEAEAIAERWSPSIKGDSWNIAKKLRSFKRSGVTIGSLFYIAKQYGFRFPERPTAIYQPRSQEPDAQFIKELERQKEEQERIEAAQAAERRRQQQDRYCQEVEQIQAELSGLRVFPTVEAAGQFIEPGLLTLPEKPGIIIVNGGMGCRKTSVGLKGLVNEHRSRTGFNSSEFAFVPRNTLGRQAGKILQLPHREEQNSYINRGTMCFESIHLVDLSKVSAHPLVLLDEVSQSFNQILAGHTCQDYHAFVVNRMRQLLATVGRHHGWIVLSEDGITNCELDLVQEASGLEVVSYLDFKREAHGRQLTLFSNPNLTWGEIHKQVFEQQKNLILPTDSQEWGRQIYNRLLEQGLDPAQVFIFDRDTSTEPTTRHFSEDPDEFKNQYLPRVIIHTPTISSGVSMEDKEGHFNAVGFHFTHLPARSSKQLLERLRSDVPRFGYAVARARVSDDERGAGDRPDLILKDLHRNQVGIAKLSNFAQYAVSKDAEAGESLLGKMAELEAQKADPTSDYGFYLRHWSRYQARQNYEQKHIQEQLIESWECQGYQVEKVGGKDPESKAQREEIKEKLTVRSAEEFAQISTEGMTLEQARTILALENSKPKERLTARKRLLQDRIPGCPLNDVDFVRKVIVDDRSSFLRRTERYWLLLNPEAATWLDRWNWFSNYSTAAKRDEWVAPQKLSNRSGQTKLLVDCPLIPFVNGTVPKWGDDTPEAIAVKQWAMERRQQLRRYYRSSIHEGQSPKKIVNTLLRLIGVEVTKDPKKKGGRGKQQRIYFALNLEDIDRDTILTSLSERFERRLQEKENGSQNLQLTNTMQVLTTPLIIEEAPISETAPERPFCVASIPVAPLQSVPLQASDLEVSEAVQAVEQCCSLQEFLEVGQRLLQGKTEQFLHRMLQHLSPGNYSGKIC